jgi:hypothetical protein
MRHFYLTDNQAEEIVVEKTLVFRRCSDGRLRLVCAQVRAAVRPVEMIPESSGALP